MGRYNVENITAHGVVSDLPSHRLPPEAWTDSNNIRFTDNRASRMRGRSPVMGTPSVAPAFVFVVRNLMDNFWVYANAIGAGSKVYVYNDNVHTDISRAGNYNADEYRQWNGDMFQGIPIFNNGVDVPQYWASIDPGTDLADLPGWPATANFKAKVVRAFGNYMFALNLYDDNGDYPHRIRWSDGAAPGELPLNWDPTNELSDSDEQDLSDTESGEILDGIALKDVFCIFKNSSTWIARYVGGQFIFSVKQAVRVGGVLTERCAITITLGEGRKEAIALNIGDDIGIFDGAEFQSVIEKRNRRRLNADIDSIHYRNCFIFDSRPTSEVWFCYPSNGMTDPDKALVWNYRENTSYFADISGVAAAVGLVEGSSSATWTNVIGTWDQQGNSYWQDADAQKVILADQAGTALLQHNASDQFNGVAYGAFLERKGLAVTGQDRTGNPIVDYSNRKAITRVWPKVRSTQNLSIIVGGSDSPDPDTVTWLPAVSFDPATQRYADVMGESGEGTNWVYNAIRFEANGEGDLDLEGYACEVEVLSEL